jgi:hypothetical protein
VVTTRKVEVVLAADTREALDEAFGLEPLHRIADDRDRDVVLCAQLCRARQPVARLEPPRLDLGGDVIDDVLGFFLTVAGIPVNRPVTVGPVSWDEPSLPSGGE